MGHSFGEAIHPPQYDVEQYQTDTKISFRVKKHFKYLGIKY